MQTVTNEPSKEFDVRGFTIPSEPSGGVDDHDPSKVWLVCDCQTLARDRDRTREPYLAASIMILDISTSSQSLIIRFANSESIHRLSLSIFRQEL